MQPRAVHGLPLHHAAGPGDGLQVLRQAQELQPPPIIPGFSIHLLPHGLGGETSLEYKVPVPRAPTPLQLVACEPEALPRQLLHMHDRKTTHAANADTAKISTNQSVVCLSGNNKNLRQRCRKLCGKATNSCGIIVSECLSALLDHVLAFISKLQYNYMSMHIIFPSKYKL